MLHHILAVGVRDALRALHDAGLHAVHDQVLGRNTTYNSITHSNTYTSNSNNS